MIAGVTNVCLKCVVYSSKRHTWCYIHVDVQVYVWFDTNVFKCGVIWSVHVLCDVHVVLQDVHGIACLTVYVYT